MPTAPCARAVGSSASATWTSASRGSGSPVERGRSSRAPGGTQSATTSASSSSAPATASPSGSTPARRPAPARGAPPRPAEQGDPGPPGPPYVDFLDRFAPAYRAELGAFVAAVGDGAPSPSFLAEALLHSARAAR